MKDLMGMMKAAQEMKGRMEEFQNKVAEMTVEGRSGGGLVTVTMSGGGEVRSVKIDPGAVDPDDVETLEDLVVAALANASENMRKLAEETMGPLTAGLGGMGGGLGLPGM